MTPAPIAPTLQPETTRRRATLAALFGLAVAAGPASAQMGGGGGGGGGGHGMHQPDSSPPDKKTRDDPVDAGPPRDLVAAFAVRLHEGVPELALTPPQQAPWHEFVAGLTEVGEHNQRRLQRIFWRSAGAVSALDPIKTFLSAEVDEGEGRQEALADLKTSHDRLDALLDERQRGVLSRLFVATRSELQASHDKP